MKIKGKTRKNKKISSRKSSRKNSRKSGRKSGNTKKSLTLMDFKKSKSISIISTMTDLKKKSTVGELYNTDELRTIMNNRCNKIVGNKVVDGVSMKKISKNVCKCLFEKNKNLSVFDLEDRMAKKNDTPGTECIKIVDAYVAKNKVKSSKGKYREREST